MIHLLSIIQIGEPDEPAYVSKVCSNSKLFIFFISPENMHLSPLQFAPPGYPAR